MSRITEQRDVQDQLINYLTGIGWKYLPPVESLAARNGDEANAFLTDILCKQLAALNSGWLSGAQINESVRRLRIVSPNLAGNEQYLKALRGQWTAFDETEDRERNLTLIDYDHIERNTFHFTQEMWFSDRDRRRLDMVLWINGLPVLLIENKSPRLDDPGAEGFRQVQTTYTEHIPEFIKYPIALAVCHRGLDYGATWNPRFGAFYTWKVDGNAFGLEALSKRFFAKSQVLDLVRDYTIFYRADDTTTKFVLRPHQMRTVQKIRNRVVDNLENGPARTGLEWHTQGSGKTLTMIVAAQLLRRKSTLANPTQLIVVDRIDLEQQMTQNLEAFGFPAVERARSKSHLRRLLRDDYRGLIVTTIHKFDQMPANCTERSNVIVLIDEAHRTQEGDLGIFMRAALPNAFYFGFTGTPIDRGQVGQGTFELFGKPDADGYHDKYGIAESIEDRTTVPLYYTLAPTDIWLDRPRLEDEFRAMRDAFFTLVEEEGVATQEALSRLLQRADKLMAVLKAPARVDAIAQHVAEHFQTNVLPRGFKALLVCVDREVCTLYKQALDEYLPEAWSVPVYSSYHKDSGLLAEYQLEEDEERRIRKAYRDAEQTPKILIVTEKLLTGFDAPIAYCMYLDKPLKDHTLLQAIARVNRPYPNKESGLIVDYMGVFENLQKALAFDQSTINTGLIDLERLKERFVELLADVQTLLTPIDMNSPQRVERALEHFFDREPRRLFFALFEELQDAFEILAPDPFLREYLTPYAEIADIYRVVYAQYSPQAERQRAERELLQKTDGLIREHVHAGPVTEPLPLYPINSNIADVVRADDVSEQVKVINLQRSIMAEIETLAETQPYLLNIGDAVEQVIQQLHERQIGVETALQTLLNQAEQLNQARDERQSSNLNNLAFGLRMVIRGSLFNDRASDEQEQLTLELADVFQKHHGLHSNRQLEGQARMKLYRVLMESLQDADGDQPALGNFTTQQMQSLKDLVDELITMHRMVGE